MNGLISIINSIKISKENEIKLNQFRSDYLDELINQIKYKVYKPEVDSDLIQNVIEHYKDLENSLHHNDKPEKKPSINEFPDYPGKDDAKEMIKEKIQDEDKKHDSKKTILLISFIIAIIVAAPAIIFTSTLYLGNPVVDGIIAALAGFGLYSSKEIAMKIKEKIH